MKVCVQGLGYIGLPTAAMLALAGHKVVGFDVDPRVLDALRNGAAHVKEEPVREMVVAGDARRQADPAEDAAGRTRSVRHVRADADDRPQARSLVRAIRLAPPSRRCSIPATC